MIGDKGLLWFDDDPALTLPEKVEWACDAFRRKYTRKKIAHVLVHPSVIDNAVFATVGGVLVMPDTSILVHHFFVLQEEDDGD